MRGTLFGFLPLGLGHAWEMGVERRDAPIRIFAADMTTDFLILMIGIN